MTATTTTLATRFVHFLHRRRYWLMSIVLLAAGGLAVMARNIRVDNSLDVWFLDDDPALIAYEHYKQQFGNDEIIVVAATDPDDIYSPAALERIRAASDRIEAHPKIRRVNSLTHGLHVSGAAGAIEIEPLLGDGPVTPEEAAALRERVAMNPAFSGTIAGDSKRMTLLLVEPKTLADVDAERPALIRDVRAIVDDTLRSGGGGAHLGGIGVVYEGLNAASIRDSAVFVTLSYLVLLLGLWVLFRRWIWVLVGVVIVSVPIIATLGIAGIAGRDMNMVTAVLPTLIMTVGILDLIHIVDAYDGRTKLLASIAVVIVPCVVNSVTDAVGFLALSSANLAAIRDFGWLAAVGLALLLISVLVFAVPALARFGGRKPNVAGRDFTRPIVAGLFRVARDHRRWVVAGALAVFAVSAWGITRIHTDTYTIGFLDEDHPVRKDHRAIEAEVGAYIPLELTVATAEADGIKDPELLRRLDRAERAMEALPEIGRVTGLPEIVKRVNQIYFDEDAGAYAIPDNARIVAEELLTYGFSADGRDNLDALVDEEFRMTHVTARTGLPSARGVERTIHNLETAGRAELGDTAELHAAGYVPLYVRIIQHITDTQIRSFAICLGVVALVLMVLLRSIKLGLVAMIPNLLPAVMTLGVMGFAGINLDVATVMIASIAIGIAVNDTCHILFRFKHELASTPADPYRAIESMMVHTGRPVVASSLLLIVGFGVLMFASVKSVSSFGLLSSVTVGSALLADLIVTPALLLILTGARRPEGRGI
jgi:hypothetical protein